MNITLIMDLQFGSTGKGLLAGYLAHRDKPDAVVAAWGPNAGHTYIREGKTHIHRQIPIGALAPSVTRVFIGPGAVIDLPVLLEEWAAVREGYKRLIIHPHAVVVDEADRVAERSQVVIGSTMKGVGEALIRKMRRSTPLAKDIEELKNWVVPQDEWIALMYKVGQLQVEAAQGFSLSIHHGFYPYTTSRDTTPYQILADCGVPNHGWVNVWGCVRTYPIRVANRYNDQGEMIGTSGPCYPDQHEIKWSDIGLEPELTTVTKLPRRIFTFSWEQLRQATLMCQPNHIFVNFLNYLASDQRQAFIDMMDDQLSQWIGKANYVRLVGLGPTDNDVHRVLL